MKNTPLTAIVTGLGFGDEGKGTIVDYLSRRAATAPLIIKSSGGAQCAHNVVTPEGTHHTFAQFGSGTFVPGTRTHLSPYFICNPLNLIREAQRLSELGVDNPLSLITMAESTLIITPFQAAAGRARAVRTNHGSCGQGIGETVGDAISVPDMAVRAKDLLDKPTLKRKLHYWRARKQEEIFVFSDTRPHEFDDPEMVDGIVALMEFLTENFGGIVPDDHVQSVVGTQPLIFEGGQGVLLDEWRGFHPHTTWSTTTDLNAWSLLGERRDNTLSIGVTRTYMTRHGNGPFPTEGVIEATEPHNRTGRYQGAFRTGALDLPLLRYSLKVCEQIDALAITHGDKIMTDAQVATKYPYGDPRVGMKGDLSHQSHLTRLLTDTTPTYETWKRGAITSSLTTALDKPLLICSYGPTARHKVATRDLT